MPHLILNKSETNFLIEVGFFVQKKEQPVWIALCVKFK